MFNRNHANILTYYHFFIPVYATGKSCCGQDVDVPNIYDAPPFNNRNSHMITEFPVVCVHRRLCRATFYVKMLEGK